METRIVSLDQAVELLKKGGVGVMPTDTVYGLVARAEDQTAVARMYALKDRNHKPGTVIAASTDQLIALGVPENHINKVKKWWPNPLSVETPLGDNLRYLHQDTGRQGFRVVADATVRDILEQTGPLVTSSANHPGKPGSVTVQEAADYFGDVVDFYVDGGDLTGRAPSTIIKITDDGSIEVIRQGAIHIDA
jgi:L-threonylcarbamoyladenylate synthase